jgi:hypothetical protein
LMVPPGFLQRRSLASILAGQFTGRAVFAGL